MRKNRTQISGIILNMKNYPNELCGTGDKELRLDFKGNIFILFH
ncbi:MAG: hypothetical protein RLZZ46_1142 [Bacteroidota bacterium]|jgi:hypothetical protein